MSWDGKVAGFKWHKVLKIVYEKTDKWYIEWQRVTASRAMSDNEWHQVKASGDEWQQMATSDNEWQWITMGDSKWYSLN